MTKLSSSNTFRKTQGNESVRSKRRWIVIQAMLGVIIILSLVATIHLLISGAIIYMPASVSLFIVALLAAANRANIRKARRLHEQT